jgi:phage head maturation protease
MSKQRTAPPKGVPISRDATIEKAPADAPARTVRFVASDETVDRYGDIIRASGWDLANFRRNPVLLFGHNSRQPPIGTVTPFVDGTRLMADATFLPEGVYDFADAVWRIVDAGALRAVSVGFLPTVDPKYIWAADDPNHEQWPTGFEFVGQELLELSVVPVPANPEALAVARSLALSEATQRRLLIFDERAVARVAAQQRRNQLTLARLTPGFFNGGKDVA